MSFNCLLLLNVFLLNSDCSRLSCLLFDVHSPNRNFIWFWAVGVWSIYVVCCHFVVVLCLFCLVSATNLVNTWTLGSVFALLDGLWTFYRWSWQIWRHYSLNLGWYFNFCSLLLKNLNPIFKISILRHRRLAILIRFFSLLRLHKSILF